MRRRLVEKLHEGDMMPSGMFGGRVQLRGAA